MSKGGRWSFKTDIGLSECSPSWFVIGLFCPRPDTPKNCCQAFLHLVWESGHLAKFDETCCIYTSDRHQQSSEEQNQLLSECKFSRFITDKS